MKIKKTYLRRPFYGEQRSIKAYDKDLAYWNSFLEVENSQEIHSSFVYANIYKARTRQQTWVIIITPIYTFLVDKQRAQLLKTIKNQNIRKLEIDKKQNKKVLIAAEIQESVEKIEFIMLNSEEAKQIVKDIEAYAKPPQSAIYYRNDE